MTRRPVPGSPFNRPTPAPQPVEEFEAQDLVTHDRYVEFGAVTHRINAPYAKLTKL